MNLSKDDLCDWIALRCVRMGNLSKLGDCWLDNGQRVPNYSRQVLARLLAEGLVALAVPDQDGGQELILTDRGLGRYERLSQWRGR